MVRRFRQLGHGTNGSAVAAVASCSGGVATERGCDAWDGYAAFLDGRFPAEELKEAHMAAGESKQIEKRVLGAGELEAEHL